MIQKRKGHPKIKGLEIGSPKFLPTKSLITTSILYARRRVQAAEGAFTAPCITASLSQGVTGFAV
jgi:hypothetical protein